MIEEESTHMVHPPKICEINIDHNKIFADIFGIVIIPTLLYKTHELNGLPERGDLRSFLLQAIAEGCSVNENHNIVPPQFEKTARSMEEDDSHTLEILQ